MSYCGIKRQNAACGVAQSKQSKSELTTTLKPFGAKERAPGKTKVSSLEVKQQENDIECPKQSNMAPGKMELRSLYGKVSENVTQIKVEKEIGGT